MENCIVFIVVLLFVPLSNADFAFDADAFCASAGGASGYYCHPDHTKYVKCAVSDGVFSGSVECCEPNYHFSSPVKACVAGFTSDESTVQHCAEANFLSGTKGLHPGMIGYACDPTNSTKFIICSANSTWAWNAHCPDDLHFDTTSKCVGQNLAGCAPETNDVGLMMVGPTVSSDATASDASTASAAATNASSAATNASSAATTAYPEMGQMVVGTTESSVATNSSENATAVAATPADDLEIGEMKMSNATSTTAAPATASNNTEGAAASNDSDADAGNMRLAPGGPRGPAGPSGRQRITCRTTYLYHPEKADWMGARDICEYDGGQLAVITNPIAQRRIASTFGHKKEFWIGATDIEREGQFRWVNGESWKFSNWYKSQPNPGKLQHCLTFNYWGKDAKWGDRHCLGSRPFLCEMEVCRPVRRRFPNGYPGSFKGPIVDYRRFPQNRNFPGARGRSGIATNYVAGGRGYPYDSQQDVRSTIHV